jgi:hypothetical protein
VCCFSSRLALLLVFNTAVLKPKHPEDVVGIRHLLEELGIWCNKPVVIYEDNQPTIQVANNERSLADAGRHLETRNYKLSELAGGNRGC